MISIYLRNKEINPSCYYRITQYFNNESDSILIRNLNTNWVYYTSLNSSNVFLKKIVQLILLLQIHIRFIRWSITDIRKKNTILVQREIFPRICIWPCSILLKKMYHNNRVIWDVDDNIVLNGEITSFEYNLLLKNASDIIVTSDNLSAKIIKKYSGRVHNLPTTDGTIYKYINERVIKERMELFSSELRLVWVGTTINLNEVERIIPLIEKASKSLKNKKIKLIIISGRKPNISSELIDIRYISWNRQNVIKELQTAHIGIMPLEKNEYNTGKGGFKLIQYLSAALPVMGSAVGINKEIIIDDVGILIEKESEWVEGIVKIANNELLYNTMSSNAINLWHEKYSSENVSKKLREIIEAR